MATPVRGQTNIASGLTITYGTAITFTVQVNLTQLSADLGKVGFTCFIQPSAVLVYPSTLTSQFSGFSTGGFPYATWPFPKDELPVMSGQVVGTLRVVYPLALEWFNNPIGKNADYQCFLVGLVISVGQWGFLDPNSTVPALRVNPGTAASSLAGTFVW